VLDEVFGSENSCALFTFAKTTGAGSPSGGTTLMPETSDYLLWYAKNRDAVKFRQTYVARVLGEAGATQYTMRTDDGRVFAHDNLTSQTGGPGTTFEFEFGGKTFRPRKGGWKTNLEGMERLLAADRLLAIGDSLRYVRYFDDFPVVRITDRWNDTVISGFGEPKAYVVQTITKVVERCVLMATDPGDLVLDPTCGSGTTAYVAEQWGRRWITIDASRVPLALTRQRLLTATFPYYELQDSARGPVGGFVYKRRQNRKGEEVGGIVPHVTLKSIANDEPPQEEVLVDRPEVESTITRVTGPFVVEATIPTPVDIDDDGVEDSGVPDDASYVDRMIEALRRNPLLQLPGNVTISLKNVRPPAQSLSLSAEAALEPDDAPVAIVFGAENGAIGEKLVYEAASEAHLKHYEQLLVIGFAIEAEARALVDKVQQLVGIPATYVQATPDLVMGDLLKTMRSSQLFSVAGLPDVAIRKVNPEEPGGPQRYEVELLGLDTFDPTTFEAKHSDGDDVPAWFLDTAWNGLSFHVSQAFFPRTSAWGNLRKALKAEFEETVWEHLSGTVSAPFTMGETNEIAVKVIDDRGNELLVTRSLAEAD
jgi:adenine-specific DNA-methyltransferase